MIKHLRNRTLIDCFFKVTMLESLSDLYIDTVGLSDLKPGDERSLLKEEPNGCNFKLTRESGEAMLCEAKRSKTKRPATVIEI